MRQVTDLLHNRGVKRRPPRRLISDRVARPWGLVTMRGGPAFSGAPRMSASVRRFSKAAVPPFGQNQSFTARCLTNGSVPAHAEVHRSGSGASARRAKRLPAGAHTVGRVRDARPRGRRMQTFRRHGGSCSEVCKGWKAVLRGSLGCADSGHPSGRGRTRLCQVSDEISCCTSPINQSLNRRTAGFCSASDVATT
jgi:hypothetical protein